MKIGTSMGLMVLVAALLMGTAVAQQTDASMAATGELPLSYTITAETDALDFPDFVVGTEKTVATDAGSTYDDLALTTNGIVDLVAYESGVTSPEEADGCMHQDGTDINLVNEMTIKAGAGSAVDVGSSSSSPSAAFVSSSTGGTYAITFGQTADAADKAGVYEITVTIAAIASS